jgi:hypothetical protein
MTDSITKPTTKDEIKVERPRLHKVILVNDDFTPSPGLCAVCRMMIVSRTIVPSTTFYPKSGSWTSDRQLDLQR